MAGIPSRTLHWLAPSIEQNLLIVPTIFCQLLKDLKLTGTVSNALPRRSLLALAERPPREIKKALHRAIGCALLKEKTKGMIELCDTGFIHLIDISEDKFCGIEILH